MNGVGLIIALSILYLKIVYKWLGGIRGFLIKPLIKPLTTKKPLI